MHLKAYQKRWHSSPDVDKQLCSPIDNGLIGLKSVWLQRCVVILLDQSMKLRSTVLVWRANISDYHRIRTILEDLDNCCKHSPYTVDFTRIWYSCSTDHTDCCSVSLKAKLKYLGSIGFVLSTILISDSSITVTRMPYTWMSAAVCK